ncbi:hypothetical protein Tco_1295980 [Tanacetum coccineum]
MLPVVSQICRFAPQLHESAGGFPKTKLVSHSCSLAGSTSAIEVSIPIAFVLPGREHECNESFKLGRSPALSLKFGEYLTIAKTEGAGTSRERAESTAEVDVARGRGGDGGGDDRPLHVRYPNGWQDHEETSGERSSGSSRCHTLLGKDPGERKAKSQFELTTTMQSPLAKISARASSIIWPRSTPTTSRHWDSQIAFWLDPKKAARAAQNAQNQAKSTVICRQGSRSLAVL